MKQVFFLSHFDLGFADLQCKIQNWIFQLRSSKSNRFGTNQFFIPQMKADLSSKKASFSNLRLQKMEDIRGQFTNYVDKFLGFLDHLPPLRWHVLFYLITVDKKSTFVDYLPTSSCQRSLWTTPYCKMHLSNGERNAIHKNPTLSSILRRVRGNVSLS